MSRPPITSIRRGVVATVAAITVSLTAAGSASAGQDSLTGGGSTPPPPPPRTGTLVSPKPVERSTTCEGNGQCAVLRAACELVDGTYSGWQSQDPGHAHEHGVCTWPWE